MGQGPSMTKIYINPTVMVLSSIKIRIISKNKYFLMMYFTFSGKRVTKTVINPH